MSILCPRYLTWPIQDMYAVELDNGTTTANGFSTTSLFNETLFVQSGLDPAKPHTIALKNQYSRANPSFVDVDYMVVTAGDGNPECVT